MRKGRSCGEGIQGYESGKRRRRKGKSWGEAVGKEFKVVGGRGEGRGGGKGEAGVKKFKIMTGRGDEEGEEQGGREVRFRKGRREEVVGRSSGEVS
jgi:hypothetical protein